MTLHLVIKALRPNGQPPLEFPIDIDSSATVEELKEQIAGRVELPQDNIRLVCAGRIWENAHTVGSYGASEGSVVHCLNNPPKQAPAAASQTLVAADPLQQMLGGGGMAAPAPSGDPMQQMMAQAQQQMTQNPEMMQQILNSPMVQQMMSNPDTIRAMARLNPQLNQLMEQRPEIARLLEDPEMLQQSMRMMANPALMREMTRNADRAIGQLDAMPGGHNALRRAHEEYADPLFDAITGRSATGEEVTSTANYTQSTEGNPNTEALPNPWGPPAAAPAAAAARPAATPAAMPTPNPMGSDMPQTTPAWPGAAGMGMGGATPFMNPFATLLSQPGAAGGAQQGAQAGMPGAQAGTPGAGNPMMAMMQQVMNNPAQMNMMQQMMSNPQQMQQTMAMVAQMRQTMAGRNPGAAGAMPGFPMRPGLIPTAAPTSTPAPTAVAPEANAGTTAQTPATNTGSQQNNPMAAAMLNAQRVRFASQLQQLMTMGFTNEAVCLQALAQHNGRVDAAIDTLLSSSENQSTSDGQR